MSLSAPASETYTDRPSVGPSVGRVYNIGNAPTGPVGRPTDGRRLVVNVPCRAVLVISYRIVSRRTVVCIVSVAHVPCGGQTRQPAGVSVAPVSRLILPYFILSSSSTSIYCRGRGDIYPPEPLEQAPCSPLFSPFLFLLSSLFPLPLPLNAAIYMECFTLFWATLYFKFYVVVTRCRIAKVVSRLREMMMQTTSMA